MERRSAPAVRSLSSFPRQADVVSRRSICAAAMQRGTCVPCSGMELFELDLAIDNHIQAGLTQSQSGLDREFLFAGQTAIRKCLPYCLLDLALRGDSDCLEELPHAYIETVFVHRYLLGSCALKLRARIDASHASWQPKRHRLPFVARPSGAELSGCATVVCLSDFY